MQVEQQAAAALKWHTIAKVFSQAFSWAVTLIVVRLLAPEDYGLMAVSTVIISIIAGTAEFGLGSSLIQAENLERRELARVAGALGLFNLVCGVALAVSAPWIASLFNEPGLDVVIQVSTLHFVLYAIEVVPQALMQREMKFKSNAAIEVAAVVAASATTLVLAWLDAGVWALVIGNLAGGVVRTGLFVAARYVRAALVCSHWHRQAHPFWRAGDCRSLPLAVHLSARHAHRGAVPEWSGGRPVFGVDAPCDVAGQQDDGHRQPGRISCGGEAAE